MLITARFGWVVIVALFFGHFPMGSVFWLGA